MRATAKLTKPFRVAGGPSGACLRGGTPRDYRAAAISKARATEMTAPAYSAALRRHGSASSARGAAFAGATLPKRA
jgi:hypothetical protein